jgi:peptide/nickel transport system permease protein
LTLFVLRRLALMIPTTLGILLVVFAVFHAVPGDPALMAVGHGVSDEADVEARAVAYRREHGLDRSLTVQFFNYLGPFNLLEDGHEWFSSPDESGERLANSGEQPWGGLLVLDFGREAGSNRSVASELGQRLQITLPLSVAAVLIAYLLALPLGVFSARKRGTRIDTVSTVALFALYSVPSFWVGLLLIYVFGATGPDWWPRLPVLGLHGRDADELGALAYGWDALLHAILPIATMTYGSFAYLSRQMRAGMLEVLPQDFVLTARAKGASERDVLYKHAFRNAVLPVVTIFATVLPALVSGSIIVEQVFQIEGMGKYVFDGLSGRDFNVVMATTVLVGVMTQVGILVSDVLYTLVDPRIRHA